VNRTLALCANDYGQNEAVNRGVLLMACRERLAEVSCMVNAPAWRDGAQDLSALQSAAASALRTG
jgi:predicted glycoside hydrolase/deacetylase ChbG (UPF0249 family)